MLQTLRRNFGLKLLAVALAITAWAYFHYSAAPSLTAHFDEQLTVPIVVTGLPTGFATQYTERTAIVTIEAPRNGPRVKAEQISAVLDLTDRSATGIINVPVKIVAPDLVIKSFAPASVTLVLDRLATRTVPVSIAYIGGTGALVVVSSHVDPQVTTVRGITTDLAKVESVKIDIPLGGSRSRRSGRDDPAAGGDARATPESRTSRSRQSRARSRTLLQATNSAGVRRDALVRNRRGARCGQRGPDAGTRVRDRPGRRRGDRERRGAGETDRGRARYALSGRCSEAAIVAGTPRPAATSSASGSSRRRR